MKLQTFIGLRPELKPVEKPLRYVMYVRKSSEDAEAQAKSLPDQIAACREYARAKGLILVGEPIQESKSAKKSGNRPLFSQMLRDLEKGVYDGILAWHPDRLSRNSLEAGMIVDMVDNEVIKDLKFPTFEFTNDSSGKLTLNMMFALSKQYSEHLSESVQRGVDSNLAQGKSSGVPKWGYNRDEVTGLYEPDENFSYIRRGWEMLLEGATRNEILDYWRAHDVHRMTKLSRRNKHPRRMEVSMHMTTTMFHDPFYYGILVQAGQAVDLRVICPNFKPMVTEEEYNKAQEMSQDRSRRKVVLYDGETPDKLFLPFRHLIVCKECGRNMVISRSRGSKGTHYLNAYCQNKECTRSPRGVRIGEILDQVYDMLDRIEFTEENYNEFVKNMKAYVDTKLDELIVEKRSLNGLKSHKERNIDELASQYSALGKDTPDVVKTKLRKQIEALQNEVINIDDQLRKINAQIIDPTSLKLTQEKFLNLLNSASSKMRAGDPIEKDILARKLFLNLEIDNQKRVTFRWREPFNIISDQCNSSKNASGGRRGT